MQQKPNKFAHFYLQEWSHAPAIYFNITLSLLFSWTAHMFSVIQKEEGEIHILYSQPFLNVHNTNTFKLLVTKGRRYMSSMEDWRYISKFIFTDKTSKNSTGYFCSMWRSLPFQVVMETNRSCNSPVVVILSIDILVHVLLLHTNTY